MAKHVQKNETITLSSGNLNLKVVNENGQSAQSMARLGSNVLVIASIINLPVGKSEDCKGKDLYIESAVRDVLNETDNVSIRITLEDGSINRTLEYFDSVPGPGEAVVFEVTIHLQ